MARSKRQVCYRDNRVIKNGDATIVYGDTYVKLAGKVKDDFMKLAEMLALSAVGKVTYETRGISKKHPEDTYDERTGRILSSVRAEVKGAEKAEEFLREFKAVLMTCEDDLSIELAKVKARKESLKKITF